MLHNEATKMMDTTSTFQFDPMKICVSLQFTRSKVLPQSNFNISEVLKLPLLIGFKMSIEFSEVVAQLCY
jgi:hypothetical protein